MHIGNRCAKNLNYRIFFVIYIIEIIFSNINLKVIGRRIIMILAGDFRNGVTFELDNNVFQIVDFQHVKPGKGAAFVRTRLKNVITGATVERTFNPTDKMPKAHIERKDMQYLYNQDELFYFMDVESYEQFPIMKEKLGDALKFVKENEVVKILSFKGNVFGIEPPTFVELEVIQTDPGFKGDTAQGASKPATLETGATIKVPLFVNQGDRIKVDTRSGEYMERA
jgi:elongation factor P